MTASTRQLREAFEGLTADIGEIDALLFTTFGLSVEFFEDSILGPLAVDQPKLSSAQDVFGASEYCDDANVGVFYDAHVTEVVDKRVTFDAYPVFVEDGAFHPKTILVSGVSGGERVVRLLVGSANLGLAGWAKNREIFSTLEVTDGRTAQPLLRLLDYLFRTQREREEELRERYEQVTDYLSEVAEQSAEVEGPQLHVTIPGETPSLMQYLADQDTDGLTVYSPYFGERPFDYLGSACPNGTVTVVAAQDEDGRLSLPAGAVGELVASESEELTLARIPDSEEEEYRFDHFKAYAMPGSLIVGSHNATQAALGRPDGTGHRNVEVSVELPGVAPPETLGFAEVPHGTPEEELSAPEDLVEPELPAAVTVRADWKEHVYEIQVDEAMPHCVIALPGIEREPRMNEETKRVPFTDRAQVELLEQKWFEVYRVTPEREQIYRGLVNERHWRTYRREAVLDSLTACFDSWVSGTVDDPTGQEEHLMSASERLLADTEGRAKPLRSGPIDDDLFENYFRFFRASQRYWERIKRALEREDVTGCVRLLVSAPGSLERVIELTEDRVEEDDEFWSVYRFVLVHEMDRLLTRIREQGGGFEDVRDVVDRLEPRVEGLVERFEDHDAWRKVGEREEIWRTARFIMRQMGYLDESE